MRVLLPPARARSQICSTLCQSLPYRLQSTTTTASSTLPPKPRSHPRTRRTLGYITLSLLLGGGLGTLVVHTISPPPHPEPGSSGDKLLVADLENRIDAEFKVKVLRGKCAAAARGLRGEEGLWVELSPCLTSSNDDESTAPVTCIHKPHIHNAMAGARGLGVSRSFWNKQTSELVSVIWLGGALSGWPGVTHGGAIATVLEEQSTLAASMLNTSLKSEIGFGSAASHVEVTYKKPTHANGFYVVRLVPRPVAGEDVGALAGDDIEVEGRLETLDGVTCVEYKATLPTHDGLVKPVVGVTDAVKANAKRGWFG